MLRAAGSAETAATYTLETPVSQEGFGGWLIGPDEASGLRDFRRERGRGPPSTTLRAGPRHTSCLFLQRGALRIPVARRRVAALAECGDYQRLFQRRVVQVRQGLGGSLRSGAVADLLIGRS
jgi:hypothetical protein